MSLSGENQDEPKVTRVDLNPETYRLEMLEFTGPKFVDISISADSKTIWVNVNNKCAFRACQIVALFVNDSRPQKRKRKKK